MLQVSPEAPLAGGLLLEHLGNRAWKPGLRFREATDLPASMVLPGYNQLVCGLVYAVSFFCDLIMFMQT